jgi:hypothetical protein
VLVAVMVKFPPALKTLVATGVHWLKGKVSLVLINTE